MMRGTFFTLRLAATLSAFGTFSHAQMVMPNKPPTRVATVADSIGMTQFKLPGFEAQQPAFSPDGNHFVLITYRGNLEHNANDASLLLFDNKAPFRPSRGEVLLAWSSASNDPALSNVRWVADNKTVLFVGGQPGQTQQLYSIDVQTRKLEQLTHHPSDILDFDATPDLRTIAYIARPQVTDLLDDATRMRGLVISDQMVGDLTSGHGSSSAWELSPPQCFIVQDGGTAQQISFQKGELPMPLGMSLSPDETLLVISTELLHASPNSWRKYVTRWGTNDNSVFFTYRLIDIRTRTLRPLTDAPTFCVGCIAWAADSKSVIVGGTYLPLNINNGEEQEQRKTTEWAVEVDAKTGDETRIAKGNYRPLRWEASTNTVFLQSRNSTTFNTATQHDPYLTVYRKTGLAWTRIAHPSLSAYQREFDVLEEQDMNTPPRLVAVNQTSGQKILLMDLNPDFRGIRFGQVEEITFKGKDGAIAKAGLYLPAEYTQRHRYPLVIQTHGWDPQEFWIDGFSTAGYAAQALAGKGFVVAQLPIAKQFATPKEGPENMAMFEALIDDLNQRGLIDRDHIGILGFSRTGYAVRYALAFSKYHMAAAVLADAMEAGYYEYIETANLRGGLNQETYESQNGAAPFGEGLKEWLLRNPSFNLDKVNTPIRELTHGVYHLGAWEWFAGLKRLGKPIELTWLPVAAHEPVKPQERMTEQQGDVDWFCFWLKKEEDPDPAKAPQYARWHELRKLQEQDEANAKAQSRD
jgi:dipeptidyl aminopeptidase/acylaminoacyl peptidase